MLMMFAFYTASAQNKLTDLYTMEPGEGYPNDMPHVKNWVNSTLKSLFIRNLQFSTSSKEDSKFLSFNPAGGAINGIELPKSKGIKLVLSNSDISILYSQKKLTYSHINISSFNYSLKEYYLLAQEIVRLNTKQMIANTLNLMIETDNNVNKTGNKRDQLIDSINNKLGIKMPYANDNTSIQSLMDVLKQQFNGKNKIEEAIYSTFIDKGNDMETRAQLLKFYSIVSFFEQNVIEKIDEWFCPIIEWKNTPSAAIIFPSSVLKLPKGDSDSAVVFNYTFGKSVLNYKKKQLEITFTGELNKKIDISSIKAINYESSGKDFLTPTNNNADPINFSELLLIVSEKGIQIRGIIPEGNQYEIIDEIIDEIW